MSRKETSNTWSDGLVMDLNPLNTPNTVLTDNLNGTLITYNGNEHLLQNDMGNYKLKNCRLSENFVPVGLKEYGDILYIVSYNPITEETEVGSYPSPAQINSATPSTIEDQGRQSVILKSLEQHPNLEYLHTDENNYSVVFADEKMKLHPGDKYDLKRITSEDYPKYEGNDYFILDEENRFHDITDFIERDLNDNGYKFVPWDVPGWLCIKSKVFNFDKYTLSITDFDKNNEMVTIGVRNKLYINDPIFVNKYVNCEKDPSVIQEFLNDLSVHLKIYIDGDIKSNIQLTNTEIPNLSIQWYEWYDNGIIVQFDYKEQFVVNTSGNSIIKIESVPILSEGERYSITYSHLSQTIESNIDSIVSATASAIKAVGEYKFYRNNSSEDSSGYGSTMKVFIDLVAADPNQIVVVEDNFRLYLTLFDTNDRRVDSIPLNNEITIGQNGISVTNEFEFTLPPDRREQIYYVTLTSAELNYSTYNAAVRNGIEFVKFGDKNKYPLITSTVFQRYMEDYDDFTTIPMKTWVEGYLKQITEGSKLEVSNISIDKKTLSSTYKKNADFRNDSDSDFLGFVKSSKVATLTPELAKLGVKYSVSFDITSNTIEENISQCIIGMWKGLVTSSNSYSIVAADSDGDESETEVIETESGSDVGEWDTNTANKTSIKVKFDTNYVLTKEYNYVLLEELKKFCKYTVRNFTDVFGSSVFFSAIIHPDKDTVKAYGQAESTAGKDKWLWVSGSGENTSAYGSKKIFFGKGVDPTDKLLSTSNNVAYVTGRVCRDRTSDWFRIIKSINGNERLIYESKGDGGGAKNGEDRYFLAIKAAGSENKYVFIWREYDSKASAVGNDLKDSKWVSSSSSDTRETYHVYSLTEGDVIEKRVETPILKYSLKTNDSWLYNTLNLFSYSTSGFDVLTMSGWESKQTSLQAEIPITYPTSSEFPYAKESGYKGISDYDGELSTLTSQIQSKLSTINSEIDLTGRDDFRGFYAGSSSIAKSLAQYLNYNDGKVTCNYTSSNKLLISTTDSSNRQDSVIGYCLDL